MHPTRSTLLTLLLVVLLGSSIGHAQERPLVDVGEPYGRLPLVDTILCGQTDDQHPLTEGPAGVSRVETLLGKPCRVLPNEGDPRYFAYRIGQGKNLRPGTAYLLTVEFPEDKPRTLVIHNRGCETIRGVRTGAALGDVIYTYTDNNCESLQVPLSGQMRTWSMLFYLHDRFPGLAQPRGKRPRTALPAEGFWVVFSQAKALSAPMSAGTAAWRIRLFEVPDPRRFDVKLNLPPDGLPQRHLFWREEMSDGGVGSNNPSENAVDNETDWFEYKARLMKFLGMNTYSKDLLEFGSNQGWDSTAYGGNDWYYQSHSPKRWQKTLEMLRRYKLTVLPYYEYAGSKGTHGLGNERRCRPLGREKDYTHVTWTEKANADVTDPDTLEDVRKLLDSTIVRHKARAPFVGAWLRQRPSDLPISFSDRCLSLFARETSAAGDVTRPRLQSDEKLLAAYYEWWFGKRKAFFVAVRDYLQGELGEDAIVMFTADSSEPGIALRGPGKKIVTDDVATWTRLLAAPGHEGARAVSYRDVVSQDRHLEAQLSRSTWGEWEWQHSVPQPDPQRYKDTQGILMTYTFNQAYTVSSPRGFDAFRTPSGLAIIRHYALNENTMHKDLDYFVTDVERAGPYCMLGEVRAVAYGAPKYLGYLTAANFNRGFAQYVRKFNAAFLALPAMPSRILPGASSDANVVVREIPAGEHGTYLAVANVGLADCDDVTVKLPVEGEVSDAATGQIMQPEGGKLRLSMGPCSLRAIRIRPLAR
jgi:hypothetical protein